MQDQRKAEEGGGLDKIPKEALKKDGPASEHSCNLEGSPTCPWQPRVGGKIFLLQDARQHWIRKRYTCIPSLYDMDMGSLNEL